MTFYSQAGQDKWVAEMTDYKTGGYFVDLGAGDGVATSNTLFLEETLGWSGLCVEGNPSLFQTLSLKRNRTVNAHCAVTDYVGKTRFGHDRMSNNSEDIEINCTTLYQLLKTMNAPQHIDYLSIDIEGQEPIVLFKFFEENDFYKIDLITLEHNVYYDGPRVKDSLFELLSANGYDRLVEDAQVDMSDPIYGGLPFEDWYKLKETV